MGDEKELAYLAVDARYVRQGVGSMLLSWGLDLCKITGLPAYVESTTQAASFYERRGFKAIKTISLNIRKDNENQTMEIYEEVACLYSPEQAFRIGVKENISK